MSAPTPWNGPLPIIFTGSYQNRQNGVGNLYVGSYSAANGGGTVFDNLVNPPTTGVAAEEASLDFAQAVGVAALTWNAKATDVTGFSSQTNGKSYYTPETVANMIKKNFDFVMNFYIENSIARDGSGNPLP